MGNILIIKNADFSAVSVSKVELVPDTYVKISVKASPNEGGSVTGSGFYPENTQVQISATPSENYRFVRWNDGNTSQERTVTVGNSDQTYIAIFREIKLFYFANGALIPNSPINETQPDDNPYRKYTSEEIYRTQSETIISNNIGTGFSVSIVQASSLDSGTWERIGPDDSGFTTIQANKYIRAYVNINTSYPTDEQAQEALASLRFELQSGQIELVEG